MSEDATTNERAETRRGFAGDEAGDGRDFRSEGREVSADTGRNPEGENGQIVVGDGGTPPTFFDGSGNPLDVGVVQAVMQEYYSGPLPAPRQLAEYEQIMPGLGDRIVGMAEYEVKTRGETTRRLAWTESLATLAVVFTHSSVTLILAVNAVFAFYKGNNSFGAFSGVAAALLAGTPQIIEAIKKRK